MSASDHPCPSDCTSNKLIGLPSIRTSLFCLILTALSLDIGSSLYQGRPAFSTFFTLVTHAYANSIGLIELRQGHLADRPSIKQTITANLQPFDIVIIAAPFKATGLTTPGRYTHVAIWLGNKQDWQNRSWDKNPRYHSLFDAVSNGTSLLQADRFGVRMSSLDDLLNADEIAIYRSSTPKKSDFYFDRIVRNVGKAYDYNLDGLNQHQMICTELVSAIFPDLSVKMTRLFGRSFILPDQIKDGLEQAENWQNWFYVSHSRE